MLTAIGVLPQVGAGGAQGDPSHPPGQQTPGVRPPDRLWVWRERGGCWGRVRHRSVLMTSVGLELWGGGCPDPMSLGTLSGFLPAGLQRHVPSPCPLPPSEEGLQQRGAEPRRCNRSRASPCSHGPDLRPDPGPPFRKPRMQVEENAPPGRGKDSGARCLLPGPVASSHARAAPAGRPRWKRGGRGPAAGRPAGDLGQTVLSPLLRPCTIALF